MARSRRAPASAERRKNSDLNANLKQLAALNIEGLRSAWREQLGSDPPPIRSPDVLLRLLAWELQARSYGGLDTKTVAQLRRIAQVLERDGTYEPPIRRDFTPGVILTREWKGTIYKVTVTGDGFRYGAQNYRSLSDVACTITGTKWSGPRFFGLERTDKKKRSAP